MEWLVENEEEMENLGTSIANDLAAGSIIALVGGLGAGKTRFSKGLARGMGFAGEVTSPTFSLMHEYRGGKLPVFHFDLYRLKNPEELLGIGWDETLEDQGVVIVEWADLFPDLLPQSTRWLRFEVLATGARRVSD